MTSPMKDRPGQLGTVSFASNGTAEFNDYRPRPGASKTSIFVNSDQPGTLNFQRVGAGGIVNTLSGLGAVAVVAGTELHQLIDFPVNQLRIVFTNNNATAGVVTAEAIDDGNT